MKTELERAKRATETKPLPTQEDENSTPSHDTTDNKPIKVGTKVRILSLPAHAGTRDGEGTVRVASKENYSYCVESGMRGDLMIRRRGVLTPIRGS